MSKILLLQGPPASGKTTFRKQFIANNDNWGYVNLDELRVNSPGLPEKEYLKIQTDNATYMTSYRIPFIVDNTNTNPNTVNRWREFARNKGYEFEVKQFFDVHYYEAVRRDKLRANKVGKSVIWKMYVDCGLDPVSKGSQRAVIFDIDGTVANLEQRRRHVLSTKKNWEAFYSELSSDTPIKSAQFLYQILVTAGIKVIFVSGRPSEHRRETEQWLSDNDFDTYDLLLMRPFNNKQDDTIIKEEIYTKYIAPYYNIEVIFDDRDRVVAMWRRLGLDCYQVNYGDF